MSISRQSCLGPTIARRCREHPVATKARISARAWPSDPGNKLPPSSDRLDPPGRPLEMIPVNQDVSFQETNEPRGAGRRSS